MKRVRNVLLMSACWAALLLTGCAGKPGSVPGAASGRGEIMTESDEPDARKRARIRLELAANYFQQGQTNVALDELKQALVTDPTYADAYNLRGLVYMRMNDNALAEDSFRRAMVLNPRDGDVLHNYGWLLCQQNRYSESIALFGRAIAMPQYGGQAKTLMTQGLCQVRAGQKAEGERSLLQSYELDAGNPVTGYNLASLLFQRGDLVRAQFYIRRLNNSNLANAETLWLGVKVERSLGNREAMLQLADQLKKRFGQSHEAAAYERGAFND
ncbi:MAG: type IV pilus biogenesis/stability protein PilW [Polaromonas sp.]|uniref:type IV pilus biogenesis/stability protein PilW n=1 Tax=Polaromonas sp. TaxID=1869339 RepID=UPI002721CA3F|nr:type IV pilus biogenesis/stability protein PilW [Polaromonas sp.]MDO9115819.1 type IV pilus biogenesis/stability protein PilW [Polaromonas sp.]MDP1885453.1 type IV pilus biogenesis/stability protein PilW [Polaromonas sp.]